MIRVVQVQAARGQVAPRRRTYLADRGSDMCDSRVPNRAPLIRSAPQWGALLAGAFARATHDARDDEQAEQHGIKGNLQRDAPEFEYRGGEFRIDKGDAGKETRCDLRNPIQ